MSERLFGTDGIRGPSGQFPIDAAGGYRLGRAVAHRLAAGAGTVYLGRDSRPSGAELSQAVIDGLLDGGCDAVDLGVVPTPAVSYFVASQGGASGVSVSASHNAADQNGFKLFGPGGEKLPEPVEAEVAAAFRSDDLPAGASRGDAQRWIGAAEQYVDFAVGTVPPQVDLRGWTVAVDCARGATTCTTPAALERLGVEVVSTCCELDGTRINEQCGSLYPARVQDLARQHGARLGLAHDGDGDRLVLVDERGEVVAGDRLLGLTATGLHDRGELAGDQVVGTILSNFGLERWLGDHGFKFHRADVGDRNVWKMMRRHGAELGGEPSGHLILRRLSRTDDALLTALHVLSVMALSGRSLHELATAIPLVPQLTVDVHVRAKPQLTTVPAVSSAMAAARALLNGDGRLVVRYSGTEAVARILAEGTEPALLTEAVGLLRHSFSTAGLAAPA